MRFYALCGSLRAASLNSVALQGLQHLAPQGVTISRDVILPHLPLFNPDLEIGALPEEVVDLRAKAGEADGLIIASPEYARGLASPMKNALDWLVGDKVLPNKPVMLVNTSPRASEAQRQLRLVLQTMGLSVVEEASLTLPLLGAQIDLEQIINIPLLRDEVQRRLNLFIHTIKNHPNAR